MPNLPTHLVYTFFFVQNKFENVWSRGQRIKRKLRRPGGWPHQNTKQRKLSWDQIIFDRDLERSEKLFLISKLIYARISYSSSESIYLSWIFYKIWIDSIYLRSRSCKRFLSLFLRWQLLFFMASLGSFFGNLLMKPKCQKHRNIQVTSLST